MSTLVEIAEYIEHVLRLDLDTPVQGYDGEELGASNEQAQALANRTFWLKQRLESLYTDFQQLSDRNYVASINKQTGAVTITYEDVGAAAKEHTHQPSDIKTTDDAGFVSKEEKDTWSNKQDKFISGETLKTILGFGLLGEGDITFTTSNIQPATGRQYVTESQIDQWNAKQSKLVSGENISTLHGKNLLAEGDIKLTYQDVGADKDGAASNAVTEHIATEDPHTQYLTQDRAKNSFVDKSTANKPNGYLQLDSSGNIPSEMAELYKARYIIVDDKAERLQIPEGGDITIALQLDENAVYYLDGEKDPSVEDNWKKGRSSDVGNITSVFGRTGIVTPVAGDYNTDQITETDNKTFVSSDDRTSWNAKQEKLADGKNIRTINGNSILGSSNIEITVDSIGAAAKEHTHTPDNIKTTSDKQFISETDREGWDAKQAALISGSNIKTINSASVLGEGDIQITPKTIGAAETQHTHTVSDIKTDSDNQFVSSDEKETWNGKQDTLSSGKSIKTVNNESLLGSGDIEITPATIGAAKEIHKHIASDITTDENNMFVTQAEKTLWTEKQDHLVSGKNISTVFGQSLLSGKDITIENVDNFSEVIFDKLKEGNETSITLDADTGEITIGRSPDSIRKNTPTIVDIQNAKAGQNCVYAIDKLSFINDIKLYKYGSILPDATTNIDYAEPTSVVTSHYPTGANSSGDYAGSKTDISVAMSSTTTGTEKYISGEIAYGSVEDYISIVPDTSLKTVIPDMTNTSTMFTVVASATYSYMDAKYAFYPPVDEGLITVPNQYFGNNQKWWVRKTDVYLGITSQEAFTILGYGFQNFEEFYWEDCTECSLWEFQARNSDSDSWVVLDKQSNKSMKNYNGAGWTNFMLDKPYTYKQYRMLFLDVFEKPKRPSVVRMAMLNYTGVLIKSAAGDYYTVDDSGNFTKITAPASEVAFKNNCIKKATVPTLVSDIKNLFPIKICSYDSVPVTIKQYKKVSAIAIQNPILPRTSYDNLKKLSTTAYYDTISKSEIRIALTPNGTDFYTYNGEWKLLGQYTASDSSASNLVANGMTFATLNAITETQWSDFLKLTSTMSVGVAYGRNVTNTKSNLTPKTASLTFNTIPGWKLVPLSKVNITFNDSKLIVTLAEDGTYKLAYIFK